MELRAAVIDAEMDALLDSIPCAAARPRAVEELPGGLTNRNLKVSNANGCCVVRVPTGGTGSNHPLDSSSDSTLHSTLHSALHSALDSTALLGIDRDREHANSVAAAEAGVGAPVLHYRPGSGLTVGFLPGTPLTDADLHDPAVLGRVAAACRQLHAGPRFVGDFDMFEVQARYRRIVAEHGFGLPPRYDEFAPKVRAIAAALGPRASLPCHNDLLAANLIDDGERVRIIDYEYAGNGDPGFELGNIWSEAALPPALLDVLVTAYWGRPRPAQVARARLFGLLAKYGWTLWAAIQDATSPLEFDFWAWGIEKYDRAVAEFDAPEFEQLLTAAAGSD